jgi:hypothetical protein
VGLSQLDDERDPVYFQMAAISASLAPGDTTDENINNRNMHNLWKRTTQLFRLSGDHELLDATHDAIKMVQLIKGPGKQIPVAPVIHRSYAGIPSFMPLDLTGTWTKARTRKILRSIPS